MTKKMKTTVEVKYASLTLQQMQKLITSMLYSTDTATHAKGIQTNYGVFIRYITLTEVKAG